MPSASRHLRSADVERYVRRRRFAPTQAGRVGIELERLTASRADPLATVDHHGLRTALAAAGPLPGGSRVTFEPGGQLDLSSTPCSDVGTACTMIEADLGVMARSATGVGVDLIGLGSYPIRALQRQVRGSRYRAMESFFRADGGDGVTMMCSTAACR
jgi:glutamate--cysteine ligase